MSKKKNNKENMTNIIEDLTGWEDKTQRKSIVHGKPKIIQ